MTQTPKFHGSKRREVIATADVSIRQVQVLDKNSQVRTLIVWQCGPDIMYADSMDGLFDLTRRKTAPSWVVDQLRALPSDRQFDHLGNSKSNGVSIESHVPTTEDDDLPDFVQG